MNVTLKSIFHESDYVNAFIHSYIQITGVFIFFEKHHQQY